MIPLRLNFSLFSFSLFTFCLSVCPKVLLGSHANGCCCSVLEHPNFHYEVQILKNAHNGTRLECLILTLHLIILKITRLNALKYDHGPILPAKLRMKGAKMDSKSFCFLNGGRHSYNSQRRPSF